MGATCGSALLSRSDPGPGNGAVFASPSRPFLTSGARRAQVRTDAIIVHEPLSRAQEAA